MQPNPALELTPAKFLQRITIIHLALVAGQILVAIVALVQTDKLVINVRYMNDPLLFVVPIAAMGGFIGSNVLYKKKISEINRNTALKSKLTAYITVFIIRMAVLEGASLLGIVAFLVTGQLLFLLISAAIIIYSVALRPTKQKVEDVLEMDFKEKMAFGQGDRVLD
ncbi:hypothetical protein [Mucilaginibacter pedocola]|uniref:Uncharacterized protein n=1 Tax=Mucilaginibacter pedocola TaxID=1792845 RepID=A0A1S9PJ79_9SPHI|nr:hypothetical protein [Mucilaginibacter pedocola]OOQ61021.1 hypothetical protein BC343_21455 [Mucilaginibacter pedocola]